MSQRNVRRKMDKFAPGDPVEIRGFSYKGTCLPNLFMPGVFTRESLSHKGDAFVTMEGEGEKTIRVALADIRPRAADFVVRSFSTSTSTQFGKCAWTTWGSSCAA